MGRCGFWELYLPLILPEETEFISRMKYFDLSGTRSRFFAGPARGPPPL